MSSSSSAATTPDSSGKGKGEETVKLDSLVTSPSSSPEFLEQERIEKEKAEKQQQQQQQQSRRRDKEESSSSETLGDDDGGEQELTGGEIIQSNWQDYYTKLLKNFESDYSKRLIKLAKQDSYSVSLRIPTGKKIEDPLDPDKKIEEYKGWEQKTYERQKIASADFKRVEKLRAEYAKIKDPDKVVEMVARMYQFLAYCYLAMSAEEFGRTDWDEIKPILDACNFRTVNSLPNSQKD